MGNKFYGKMCDTWVEFKAKNITHINMLIKYRDQNNLNRLEFIVTNLKKLWHQLVLYQDLKGICEISSDKDTFMEHFLKAVIAENSELHFTEPSDSITLENESRSNFELIAYFGGLATSFKFTMAEMLDGPYKHITIPLLALLQHSKKEKAFLLKQIKARDDEIQEWRATNATITRTLLKTEKFSELESRFPMEVPENILEISGHLLSSTTEYKDICIELHKMNMFDAPIKTEIQTDFETTAVKDEKTDPTKVPSVVPKRENKDGEEASTSSGHKKHKEDQVVKTKVKQKKSRNTASLLTAASKSQANKKVKAKTMLI